MTAGGDKHGTESDHALLAAAAEAAHRAYAPYSGLHVGAALQTTTGEIATGCNVENISYGLTCCAERSAVFAAVGGVGAAMRIARLAVVAHRGDGELQPVSPCGACRQVMREFAADDCEILFMTAEGVARRSLESLLPDAFAPPCSCRSVDETGRLGEAVPLPKRAARRSQ